MAAAEAPPLPGGGGATAAPPPPPPPPAPARGAPPTPPPLVVFLALGTRGDVQPLALLAWALGHGGPLQGEFGPPPDVVLVTHAAHAPWLAALLPGLRLGAGLPHAPGAAAGSARVDSPEARAALVAACCDALQVPPPRGGGDGREGGGGGSDGGGGGGADAQAGRDRSGEPPHPRARLLVFNLFALEGAHLAEALGVPCAAAHPYPIPYAAPAAFERRLAAAHPRLHATLREADPVDGSVTWSEVGTQGWAGGAKGPVRAAAAARCRRGMCRPLLCRAAGHPKPCCCRPPAPARCTTGCGRCSPSAGARGAWRR
jgi:hypothetical protein